MGLLDLIDTYKDGQGKRRLGQQIVETVEKLEELLQGLNTMETANMIAVAGTLSTLNTSLLLQAGMKAKLKEKTMDESKRENTDKLIDFLFREFVKEQMELAYFYAIQMGIDTDKALESIGKEE